MKYCHHANNEELLEHWNAVKGKNPIQISAIEYFDEDMCNAIEVDTPQQAFAHYVAESHVLSLAAGETITEHIWCVYSGYTWLVGVISASAPYDAEGYTFEIKASYNHDFVLSIDSAVNNSSSTN